MIGGDTIVTFSDTPAIEAFVQVPRHAGGGARPGREGRLRDRQQERCRRASTRTRSRGRRRRRSRKAKNVAGSTCPTSSRPSFGATVGQGEWGLFQDFLRNPKDVNGHPDEARGGGRHGLQEGEVARLTRGQHHGGAARLAAAPPSAGRAGAGAGYGVAARCSLLPAPSSCSASGSSTRPSTRSSAASSASTASSTSSGSTTTRRSSRRRRPDDGDQEQPDLGRGRAGVRDRDRARSSPC